MKIRFKTQMEETPTLDKILIPGAVYKCTLSNINEKSSLRIAVKTGNNEVSIVRLEDGFVCNACSIKNSTDFEEYELVPATLVIE